MKLRTALMAATVLALPAAAMAQPISGLYVGAGAGYNILMNENVKSNPGPVKAGHLSFNGGLAGVGSVGYGLGNGLRLEVEGNYRDNRAHGLSNYGSASGDEQKYGVMVNALYDFTMVPYVTPYVGAGVGYAWSNLTNFNAYRGSGARTSGSDTDGSFAYQGIAGLAYPIPQVPGLAITAEYRFFGLAEDMKYDVASYNRFGQATFGTLKTTNNYNHSLMLGVRYAFNAAPPPPPPAPAPMVAPAPAPARTYLVFFDWDKADLTDRARQIVGEAATASTHVTYTKIQVNGYTDTSGTPAYNQRLSVRRAQAVAAELVKDGVPKTAISIAGFGETHLLVPTAAGVREPQNRRVEIIIQ